MSINIAELVMEGKAVVEYRDVGCFVGHHLTWKSADQILAEGGQIVRAVNGRLEIKNAEYVARGWAMFRVRLIDADNVPIPTHVRAAVSLNASIQAYGIATFIGTDWCDDDGVVDSVFLYAGGSPLVDVPLEGQVPDRNTPTGAGTVFGLSMDGHFSNTIHSFSAEIVLSTLPAFWTNFRNCAEVIGFIGAPAVAVTDTAADSITISIAAAAGDRAYYTTIVPQYRVSGADDWIDAPTQKGRATTYTFTGLGDSDIDYDLRVIATTRVGSVVTSEAVVAHTTPAAPRLLAVAHNTAPRLTVYDSSWAALADPVVAPTGNANEVAFSPDGTLCAVAHATAPRLTIYDTTTVPWTKLTGPGTLPAGGTGNAVAFSPDGSLLALGNSTTPFLLVYNTTTWAKWTNPVSLPLGAVNGVAISPDGAMCALASGVYPYLVRYDITGGAGNIPVKLADVADPPNAFASDLRFSADGSMLVVTTNASPYIQIYETATWTKLTGTPVLGNQTPGSATDAAFSPNGALLAVTHSVTPFVSIFETTGWTKLADPAVLPTNSALNVAFSADGSLMAVAHAGSPFLTVYDTATWQVVSGIPAPAGQGNGVAFTG